MHIKLALTNAQGLKKMLCSKRVCRNQGAKTLPLHGFLWCHVISGGTEPSSCKGTAQEESQEVTAKSKEVERGSQSSTGTLPPPLML